LWNVNKVIKSFLEISFAFVQWTLSMFLQCWIWVLRHPGRHLHIRPSGTLSRALNPGRKRIT
jgi:hypothetical protein